MRAHTDTGQGTAGVRALPPERVAALVYVGSGSPATLPWESVRYLRNWCAASGDSIASVGPAVVAGWDLPVQIVDELRLAVAADLQIIAVEELDRLPSGGRSVPLLFAAGRALEVATWFAAGDLASVTLVPGDLDPVRVAVVEELALLYDLTAVLRAECPWDRAQTQAGIVRYTLEETYELVDAVAQANHHAAGDAGVHRDVMEELGDLLFQVYFLAVVAQEEGRYHLGDVAYGIRNKLIRRHPHIFGDTEVATADDVRRNWEEIKRHTEGREGVFHEVPASLPSPLLAQKLQARAAEVGFDWPDAEGPLLKVEEELAELRRELSAVTTSPRGPAASPAASSAAGSAARPVASELGDLLFAVINVARKLKVDPELALRSAGGRFRARVERAVELAQAEGRVWAALDLDQQEGYYQRAKAEMKP